MVATRRRYFRLQMFGTQATFLNVIFRPQKLSLLGDCLKLTFHHVLDPEPKPQTHSKRLLW
jgi:hypothetical protein